MAYPNHNEIKDALLELLYARGGSRYSLHLNDIYEKLADGFNLSKRERTASYREVQEDRLSDENYWQNAIRTAKARLIDEKMLEKNPGRGICKLTPQALRQLQRSSSSQRTTYIVQKQEVLIREDASTKNSANENDTPLTYRENIERLIGNKEQQFTEKKIFDPTNIVDGRNRTIASIVRRRGQPTFRKTLISIYEGRCAITGTNGEPALEAAHITPYRGDDTNHPTNGLLLRSDIHTLFDLRLISVDTSTMSVIISATLKSTDYSHLAGKKLLLPKNQDYWPSKQALDLHRKQAEL